MFGLGTSEIVIILVVVAIFFFGGERMSDLARGLGRFTGEFKKGKEDMERELRSADKDPKKPS